MIEALACGVPALGTPVGIHPVALGGIEGCLCEEWDAGAWRAALAPLLADPDPRVDGAARAELFSADRMAARVVAAWRDVATRLTAPPTLTRSEAPGPAPRAAMFRRRKNKTEPDDATTEIPAADGATAEMPPPEPQGVEISVPAGTDLDKLVGDRPTTQRRGRLRRRLRHLRGVREVLLRDLGGMVFEVHRAGAEAPALVQNKLDRLAGVNDEIHELETALDDRRGMVVREPGIGGTCPNCGELFGSAARFCWACGTPVAPGARRPPTAIRPADAPALQPHVDGTVEELPRRRPRPRRRHHLRRSPPPRPRRSCCERPPAASASPAAATTSRCAGDRAVPELRRARARRSGLVPELRRRRHHRRRGRDGLAHAGRDRRRRAADRDRRARLRLRRALRRG